MAIKPIDSFINRVYTWVYRHQRNIKPKEKNYNKYVSQILLSLRQFLLKYEYYLKGEKTQKNAKFTRASLTVFSSLFNFLPYTASIYNNKKNRMHFRCDATVHLSANTFLTCQIPYILYCVYLYFQKQLPHIHCSNNVSNMKKL